MATTGKRASCLAVSARLTCDATKNQDKLYMAQSNR
eukprot:CAMPEP_0170454834 /NCGR_PEP_ID=MMETSP0123-20130129/2953_1 /TAXON_ID=182087 /ORGANISM="Favella ehrenbergii, Strain Fehren 1" /LENGTH=35 /DNA_ID= /DNA_START= /DNA_END= /DNA_ORIENTATION=